MWKDRNASRRRCGSLRTGLDGGRWRFSFSPSVDLAKNTRTMTHATAQLVLGSLDTITVGLARSLARCGNFIPFPFTCRLLGWTMKERLEYRNYIASRLYPWTTLGWITPRYRASLLAASVVRIEHLNYDSFSNCCYYIAVCSMLQLPKWPKWPICTVVELAKCCDFYWKFKQIRNCAFLEI